ncbi:MAG TPA: YjbH domain-containing protein [Rhodothermales bacterium]|nr:YjbH domain-containing protein [Rhodothermales bacterium]
MRPAAIALGLLALLAGSVPGEAQIVGTTSLITIPVADMPPDGTITVGGGFVDKRYSEYLNGRADYTPVYLSVEFLPFLELAFRFSRPVNLDDRQRLGDRMVSARLRLLNETPRRPAILVGAHDFLTVKDSNHFHALYIVGSKHFQSFIPIGLHLGYGSNVLDARAYQFVGVFGGISLTVVEQGELLVEYDADRFSAGIRYELLDRFRVLLALQGLDSIIAGASMNVRL